jgi:hypothetical protein
MLRALRVAALVVIGLTLLRSRKLEDRAAGAPHDVFLVKFPEGGS